MTSVSVTDANDSSATPHILWSASSPKGGVVAHGTFVLWSGEGFRRSSAPPPAADVPAQVDILFATTSGEDGGDVLDLHAVRHSRLQPGQYWTSTGIVTARHIDDQLKCKRETSQ
jgi:hypothetical protein